MLDRQDSSGFLALRHGDPVLFRPDACLIVRRPGAECGLCRDACPKAVLGGGEWSVALETDGCIGCGLCAAACPTGAIAVEGFAPVAALPNSGAETAPRPIECARVPDGLRRAGAEVVPCLGGLSEPDLLERAATRGAVLIDRGLCGGCEVGCGATPWAAALAGAEARLAHIEGLPEGRLSCEAEPLDPARARPTGPALRPDLHAKTRPSRRELFRRVLAPEPEESPLERSRRIIEGRGLITPLRRNRELASLAALAADAGVALPTAFLPAIRLADACGMHGVCAAICPTGALRLEEGGSAMALTFAAADCISCNECQRACPTRALSLWPEGDGSLPAGRQTLKTSASRACDGCGASFALDAGDTTTCYCPICQKSIGLMQAMSAWRSGCPSA